MKKNNNHMKFQDMAKKINTYLVIEKISLNFDGYNETVARYFRLDDSDISEAYSLMTECNLWNNYFADIEGIVKYYTLSSQISLDKFNATYNKKLENEVLDRRFDILSKRYKDFKVFSKQIMAQKVFFENAFWHCYKIYAKSVKTYMNYNNLT